MNPRTSIDDQEWVTAEEASRRLAIKRETLYSYASRGLVRSTHARGGDRKRLYHRDDLGRKASLIAKILGGANPADIPFELPDAYELTINRTTAALLGLTIPPDVLVRATDLVD